MKLVFATPTEVCAELGTRLKSRRIALKFTQQELADRAEVAISTISNLEQGRGVSFLTVITVAQLLGFEAQLEPLFKQAIVSIADLESQKAQPQRVRHVGKKSNANRNRQL